MGLSITISKARSFYNFKDHVDKYSTIYNFQFSQNAGIRETSHEKLKPQSYTLTFTCRIASIKSRTTFCSFFSTLISIGNGAVTFSSSATLKTLLLHWFAASIFFLSSSICSVTTPSSPPPEAEPVSSGSGATRAA